MSDKDKKNMKKKLYMFVLHQVTSASSSSSSVWTTHDILYIKLNVSQNTMTINKKETKNKIFQGEWTLNSVSFLASWFIRIADVKSTPKRIKCLNYFLMVKNWKIEEKNFENSHGFSRYGHLFLVLSKVHTEQWA